jgi:hypothetical protein
MNDNVSHMTKPLQFGDIYSNAYDLAQKSQASTALQVITSATRDFNGKYKCSLTSDDVMALFNGVDYIREALSAELATLSQSQKFTDQTSFNAACIRATSCIQGKNVWRWDVKNKRTKAQPITAAEKWRLSDQAFMDCRNYALAAYQGSSSIIDNATSLATTSVGNDIYYNGTLDDSPFDLLVDMQEIGDMLFAKNEKTDSMVFYSFPQGSIAGSTLVPFGKTAATAPSQAWNPWSLQGNNGGNTTQNSQSTTWNTTTGMTTQAPPSTQETKITTLPLNDLPSLAQWQISDPIAAPSQADEIQNYACTPVDTSALDTAISSQILSGTQIESSTTTATTNWLPIKTTLPPVAFNQPYSDDAGLTFLPAPIDPKNDTRESPSEYEAQAAKIESCLNTCKDKPAADKALCAAKCMCGTTYSQNGIFGLSICTIPSKQTDVVRNKKVMSIEEIFTELNNVLIALKQSGEMIKHTKTKEFLDTSLSKIKMNQIFAIDVSVWFKPMLDQKPRKKEKAEEQTNTDQILRWNYGDITLSKERNKYIALGNPTLRNSLSRWSATSQTLFDNAWEAQLTEANARQQQLDKSLSTALSQTQNAEVTDLIKKFLEENARFRSYVRESVDTMAKTSDALKQKIEKGS